jgi:hypothetical protein
VYSYKDAAQNLATRRDKNGGGQQTENKIEYQEKAERGRNGKSGLGLQTLPTN